MTTDTKRDMPIVSDCPECQAIQDGKHLFLAIEEIAKREDVEPSRMLRAIREALTAWASVVWKAWPEDIADIDDEADRLVQSVAESLDRALRDEAEHLH